MMRRMWRRAGAVTLAVGVLVGTEAAATQAEVPTAVQRTATRTVPQLFVELPAKWAGATTVAHRKDLVRKDFGRLIVDDRANGYLAISGDGGDPGHVVTRFRTPSGGWVLGVQQYWEQGQCTRFLSKNARGQWVDLSRRLVPRYNGNIRFNLPRKGTTVTVSDANGQKILRRYAWRKGRFVLLSATGDPTKGLDVNGCSNNH